MPQLPRGAGGAVLSAGGGPGEGIAPLVAIELSRVAVPMRVAHRSAVAEQSVRESILVRVVAADGSDGHAECPTLSGSGYVTESTDAAWAALSGELAAARLAGRQPSGHAAPAASAALTDAVSDHGLRTSGVPLADHLAVQTSTTHADEVRWTAVLAAPGEDPAELSAAAVEALGAGASILKAKVEGPRHLHDAVAALRSAGATDIALDANGTLSPEDLRGIDELGLAYLEQPLPAGTPWPALAEAASVCGTPLALDESLVSLDSLADALRAGACEVANIKPARMGGTLAAARAVALCHRGGVACFVGGMFELGLGRAAALAVASLAGCTLPTDLGPSGRYFEVDVTEPLVTGEGGLVSVPGGPGCGRVPIEELVEEHLVQRVRIG